MNRHPRIDSYLLRSFRSPVGHAVTLAAWCNKFDWSPACARVAWGCLVAQGLILETKSGWVLSAAGRNRAEAA